MDKKATHLDKQIAGELAKAKKLLKTNKKGARARAPSAVLQAVAPLRGVAACAHHCSRHGARALAAAMQCLKKKKMYEGQQNTLNNTKFAMEQQVSGDLFLAPAGICTQNMRMRAGR